MKKVILIFILFVTSCSQGLTEEEATELVAQAVAEAMATTTTLAPTTTTLVPTTTTLVPTTTTLQLAETVMPEIWNINFVEQNNNISLEFELKLPTEIEKDNLDLFIDQINFEGLEFPICNTLKINYWEDYILQSSVGPTKDQYEQDSCSVSENYVGFASTYVGMYAEENPVCELRKFNQIPKITIQQSDPYTLKVIAPLWRVSRYLCGYFMFDSETMNDKLELDSKFFISSYDDFNQRAFPSNGSWWIVLNKIEFKLPFYGEKCEMKINFSESRSHTSNKDEYINLMNLPRNIYLFEGCDYRVLSWVKSAEEENTLVGQTNDGVYFYDGISGFLSGENVSFAIQTNLNNTWNSQNFPNNSVSTKGIYYENPENPTGLNLYKSYKISYLGIPAFKIDR